MERDKMKLYMLIGLIINSVCICTEDPIELQLSLKEEGINNVEKPAIVSKQTISPFKTIASLFIIACVARSISAIIHECGHGFIAHALGQEVVRWNLKPIFYLNGYPSVEWVLSCSAFKNSVITAAGPIAGIIGGVAVSKICAIICRYFLEKSKIEPSVTHAYTELVEIHTSSWNTFTQFLNFLPLNVSDNIYTDGVYIQEFLEELSPNLSSMYPYITIAGFIASFCYGIYNTYKAGREFYIANTQSTLSEEEAPNNYATILPK